MLSQNDAGHAEKSINGFSTIQNSSGARQPFV
jgi:hypothetical protein